MSWGWGSLFGGADVPSPDAIPAATPLQQQRLKQIESLSIYNKNVIEDERDKDYSIQFLDAGRKCTLKITLPPQFPNEKPLVKVSPIAKHPWLDDQMYVTGCGALNSFYMHSNLGKVVKQIIEELQESNSFSRLPVNLNSSNAKGSSNEEQPARYLNLQSPSSNTPTAMLICTDAIDSTEGKNSEKLLSECKSIEELLDAVNKMPVEDIEKQSQNIDELLQYVTKMDVVTDLQSQRAALLESNIKLAEHNLTFKPKIENAKKNLEAIFTNIETLESDFTVKCDKQEELFQVFDLNNIITNLRIAVSQAEESSEELADQFLEGNIPVDEFLKRFIDQRKLLHTRQCKEERIRYLNPEY